MPNKTIDHARARASTRGDAVATLLFGAAMIIASVIVALAETDVPKHMIGFGMFLMGVALVASRSLALDCLAAARRTAEQKSGVGDECNAFPTRKRAVPEVALQSTACAHISKSDHRGEP
jgi:hypothetical protein